MGAEETHWLGLEGQTALVWAGEVGGGRNADGGDGECVCADEEGKVVCVLEGEAKEEEEATGSPQGGCCCPPEKEVRG